MKKGNKKTYIFFQVVSAIIMILALLWLTVSTPFVYASQQETARHSQLMGDADPLTCNEEEAPNTLGNTTEEKNSKSGNSFSEEYVHDHHVTEYFLFIASHYHTCENSGTYNAFHGEVLVPPPNVT